MPPLPLGDAVENKMRREKKRGRNGASSVATAAAVYAKPFGKNRYARSPAGGFFAYFRLSVSLSRLLSEMGRVVGEREILKTLAIDLTLGRDASFRVPAAGDFFFFFVVVVTIPLHSRCFIFPFAVVGSLAFSSCYFLRFQLYFAPQWKSHPVFFFFFPSRRSRF